MRRIVCGATVVALALAVGAVPVAASAAAKPKGDPVKVMVIYEKSAGVASPEIPDGAKAAAKAMNKKNGIGGRPVEVLVCDTNNDPNTAAECGRKAVDEGVVALIGVLTPHSASVHAAHGREQDPVDRRRARGHRRLQRRSSFPVSGGIVATRPTCRGSSTTTARRRSASPGPTSRQAASSDVRRHRRSGRSDQAMKNDVPVPHERARHVDVRGGCAGRRHRRDHRGAAGQQALNFVQAARQADPDVKLALISTEPGPCPEGAR